MDHDGERTPWRPLSYEHTGGPTQQQHFITSLFRPSTSLQHCSCVFYVFPLSFSSQGEQRGTVQRRKDIISGRFLIFAGMVCFVEWRIWRKFVVFLIEICKRL